MPILVFVCLFVCLNLPTRTHTNRAPFKGMDAARVRRDGQPFRALMPTGWLYSRNPTTFGLPYLTIEGARMVICLTEGVTPHPRSSRVNFVTRAATYFVFPGTDGQPTAGLCTFYRSHTLLRQMARPVFMTSDVYAQPLACPLQGCVS